MHPPTSYYIVSSLARCSSISFSPATYSACSAWTSAAAASGSPIAAVRKSWRPKRAKRVLHPASPFGANSMLAFDFHAHAAGGAGNHLFDCWDVVGVHVFGFGFGNFG